MMTAVHWEKLHVQGQSCHHKLGMGLVIWFLIELGSSR
jgi:hypothetical protein